MKPLSGGVVLLVMLLPILAWQYWPVPEIVARPVAGDVVTPEIEIVKTWEAGGQGLFYIRLHVQGDEESEARYLFPYEVPEEATFSAGLTFFEGTQVLENSRDFTFVRDC